jgi:hypothetical protein
VRIFDTYPWIYRTGLCVKRLSRYGPFSKKVGNRSTRGSENVSKAHLARKERDFGHDGRPTKYAGSQDLRIGVLHTSVRRAVRP